MVFMAKESAVRKEMIEVREKIASLETKVKELARAENLLF